MHRIHLDLRIINSTAAVRKCLGSRQRVSIAVSLCLSVCHTSCDKQTHRAQGFLKAHLVEMSGTEGGTAGTKTLKGEIDDATQLGFVQNGWHCSQISHLANDACGIQSERQGVC